MYSHPAFIHLLQISWVPTMCQTVPIWWVMCWNEWALSIRREPNNNKITWRCSARIVWVIAGERKGVPDSALGFLEEEVPERRLKGKKEKGKGPSMHRASFGRKDLNTVKTRTSWGKKKALCLQKTKTKTQPANQQKSWSLVRARSGWTSYTVLKDRDVG